MKYLFNFIWFFVGLIPALEWLLVGILWCITIVGIPVGLQCFKFFSLVLFPFGKQVVYKGGVGSCLLNILWLIFGGLELALSYVIIGLILTVLIVTIPFALQCFKFARLALMPFGAEVVEVN